MGIFYVFYIVKIVPKRAKHHIYEKIQKAYREIEKAY